MSNENPVAWRDLSPAVWRKLNPECQDAWHKFQMENTPKDFGLGELSYRDIFEAGWKAANEVRHGRK